MKAFFNTTVLKPLAKHFTTKYESYGKSKFWGRKNGIFCL